MEDNIRTEIINSIINGDIDHASELVETHKQFMELKTYLNKGVLLVLFQN